MRIGSSPKTSRTVRTSSPETTTPAAPADTASNASDAGDAKDSPPTLERTVTATTRGAGNPASAAPFAARSRATTRGLLGREVKTASSPPEPFRPERRPDPEALPDFPIGASGDV